MASIKQIAITKERAIRSMQASAARIQAVHNDIAPLEITAWRDPQYNEAMQLEAIAKWLAVLTDAIAPAPVEMSAPQAIELPDEAQPMAVLIGKKKPKIKAE